MKRSREEEEQPGVRARPPDPTAPVGPDGQLLTPKDALSYLQAVKDAFKDNMPKYEHFLQVMKEYKANRIGTVGVVERVKELFQGHQDLILGFNTFLPAGYEIKLPLEDPAKKDAELKEAINFVNKIKNRFMSEDHTYKSFLGILNLFREGHKSIAEVYQEVSALFQNHPDLLAEFAQFLPDNTVAGGLDKKERTNGLPVDHGRDSDPGRASNFEARNLSDKGQEGRRGGKDIELDESKDLNTQQFTNNHSNAHKLEKGGVFHQDILFCEEVRKRMQRPADFPQFLKCLQIYSKDLITRKELMNLVADFIGRESDLFARFPDFLTHCKNIDECLAFYSSNLQHNEENDTSFVKAKDQDRDREPRERDRNDRNTGFGNKDNVPQKSHSYSIKDKYMAKPISELDLSNCARCTPSYRLLPPDYPIPAASHRSGLGTQVLNDQWVSVTSGSEDYSFKHMRKNQYEESLFRCEDDRFELDMLLESVHVIIKRVEELQAKIDSRSILPGEHLRIDDHLNALNLRTIDRLYGDHANDVMEVLKKNAVLALPVVYTRLKQKQEEWLRCRAEFNKVWAEIYAKNYHKSLDHRSFYFKQQDTKSLSTKVLLLEIKELSEDSRKEESKLDALDAWNRRPLKSNLTLEYPDPDIHEDLYQLVKYSCGEVCTTEQLEKAMNIWTSFLEPLLGVPSRPDEPEDSEDGGNSNSHGGTGDASPISDTDCGPEADSVKDSEQASPLEAGDASELSNLCRGGSVNGVKEDVESISTSRRIARVQKDAVMVNNISNAMKQACLNERPAVDSSFTADAGENKKTEMETASDELANLSRQSGGAVGGVTAVGDGERSTTTATKDSAEDKKLEEFIRPEKTDREEGELSPNGDFGENNFVAYGDAPFDDVQKVDVTASSRPHINPPIENDDEESPQRSTEDSDNATENGEVSGTDSGEEENEEETNNGRNDNKAESEGEAEGIDDGNEVDGKGNLVLKSERVLSNVKPLAKHVPRALQDQNHNSRVFYGNDSLYVLFRLHQTLYERIRSAKINSSSAEKKWKSLADDDSSTDQYARFMSALYSLLDGSSDNTKFEDDCRAIIGTQSYVLFTLDKLIFKLVKQLQTIAGDETDNKLVQLYAYENSRKSERFVDSVYHENARVLLHDGNIYRMECLSNPCRMTIQLMDHGNDKPEITAVSIEPKFSSYLHDDFLRLNPDRKEKSGIFMKRNKRKNSYGDDESVRGLKIFNGLECKITCKTSKVSYVLDTTDVLYRPNQVRRTWCPHKTSKLSTLKSIRSNRLHKVLERLQ